MIRRQLITFACATFLVVAGALSLPAPEPAAAAPRLDRADCGGERPAKPGGGRYACAFDDDFSGDTLDDGKWVVQQTALNGMTTGAKDCYVANRKNVWVSGGQLHLRSQVEAKPFVCPSPLGNFTSKRTVATVASWSKFTQTYGRFEFRAKMPNHSGPGLHSAVWLYPQAHTYGAWPSSGEIDVAEWYSGDPRKAYPSVHYAGEDWTKSTGFDCSVAGASTGFHRYAVEWTPSVMRFFYDGRLCFTHAWTPNAPLAAPQPFDRPFYLVMTQVFGSAWNAVDGGTPASGEMAIDWVRAWR